MNFPSHINISWGDRHQHLDYVDEDFKDPVKLEEWKKSGFDLARLKIGLHQLKSPYDWMQCVTDVVDTLKIKNPAYCIHRLTPGNFLPTHSDLYSYYAKINNISDIDQIIRFIIFLDDAVPGQILIVGDQVYNSYKKGDVAYWTGTTPHLAANLGNSNRYTLQITGTLEK